VAEIRLPCLTEAAVAAVVADWAFENGHATDSAAADVIRRL
jgi:hypothetical protein